MKVAKSYIKQLIKEEIEAVLKEGYAGMKYKHNPSLRPTHPSDKREAPDFSTQSMQMKMAISAILRDDGGLRISQAGMASKEIVNKIHDEGFNLADYLTNTIGIPADQSTDIAEKINKTANK